MILFTFGLSKEEAPAIPSLGRRAWRWAFEVEGPVRHQSTLYALSIGFVEQVLFECEDWGVGNRYYNASLTSKFGFEQFHAYYDGPNCGIRIGFLLLTWSGDWCLKCMPES